jgi:hypothetical protein
MPRSDPPQPRWLDEREQRAWWALLEVGSGLFDALSVDLRRRADLTLEDYEVLHLLSVSADRSGWTASPDAGCSRSADAPRTDGPSTWY